MDVLAKARQVIEIETEALQGMAAQLDGGFTRAVEILKDTLDRRGKIVVALPGSENAVRLALTRLLIPELRHLVSETQR